MDIVLNNKVLIVPAIAWCVAQILKVIISLVRDRKLNLTYLFDMGRMPSAHATVVSSLATVVAKVNGVGSALFAITVFLALIVMYDAAGVRQTVSTQSVILNRMLDELFKGNTVFEQRLREFIGHTKLEVVAGAFIGVLLGWLLAWR
ncbi:MAG: divergent PAP2 family protein [Chloroflexota bacterium]